MNRRINIILPDSTVQLLDRAAPRGNRSRLIDQAVRFYIGEKGRARLRTSLKEGYRRRAESNLQIAADWFTLDEEAWQKSNL